MRLILDQIALHLVQLPFPDLYYTLVNAKNIVKTKKTKLFEVVCQVIYNTSGRSVSVYIDTPAKHSVYTDT